MKNRAAKKLKSSSGASITFALLILLVCAVVGAVVLTAGTAAAGRVSELTEMDARYYSVASAAQLVADTVNGQRVTVELTRTTDSTVTNSYEKTTDGVFALTNSAAKGSDTVNYFAAVQRGSSFLTDATIDYLCGSAAFLNTETAWLAYRGAVAAKTYGDLTLTHEARNGINTDVLAATVTPRLTASGDLILKVQNTNGDDHYALEVVFEADPVPHDGTDTVVGNPENVTITDTETGAYTEDITTTVTETKSTTVTWRLSEVRKAVG